MCCVRWYYYQLEPLQELLKELSKEPFKEPFKEAPGGSRRPQEVPAQAPGGPGRPRDASIIALSSEVLLN